MGVASWMRSAVPYVAMIAVEFTDVSVSTINKAALSEGMSKYVSIVYYNALAILLLIPYFVVNRKKRAPLTSALLWRFFLLGLIGSVGQILFLSGVKLSSPTLASALANLIPIFTFLLAVITGMETLNLREHTSQAKSLGAVVSVTGAFIVTLYKGPAIWATSSTPRFHDQTLLSQQSQWVLGGFCLVIVCLLSATWNIAQGATVKEYPEEMTIVFFFTFFSTVLAAFFSLVFERNPNAWKLEPGIELAAIVHTALFGSLFRIAIHTWCLHMKGPVFVAMFRPLGIAIAVFMTVIFLGDTLYLGSVIGSIIIALGFYSVMWGLIKEKKMVMDNQASSSESTASQTASLLQGDALESL